MPKKRSLTLAYGASLLLNIVFWLCYGHSLRFTHSVPPAPVRAERAAAAPPLPLGLFVPLPRVTPPKPTHDSSGPQPTQIYAAPRDIGTQTSGGTDTGGPSSASASGRSAASALTSGGRGTSVGRPGLGQSAGGGAETQTADGRGVGRTGAAPTAPILSAFEGDKPGVSSANGSRGGRPHGTTGQTRPGGERMAQKETGSGRPQATMVRASSTAVPSADAAVNLSTVVFRSGSGRQTSQITGGLEPEADASEADTPDRPRPESGQPAQPTADMTPRKIVVRVAEVWTPQPGQKFALPHNLDIQLAPDMKFPRGIRLTPDQMRQLQTLLAQQVNVKVPIDVVRQIYKVAMQALQQAAPPKADKPPKPHHVSTTLKTPTRRPHHTTTAVPHPQAAKADSVPRPQNPFHLRPWNVSMLNRFGGTDLSLADSGPRTPESGTAGPLAQTVGETGTAAAGGVRVASSAVPGGETPANGEGRQDDPGMNGAQPGTGKTGDNPPAGTPTTNTGSRGQGGMAGAQSAGAGGQTNGGQTSGATGQTKDSNQGMAGGQTGTAPGQTAGGTGATGQTSGQPQGGSASPGGKQNGPAQGDGGMAGAGGPQTDGMAGSAQGATGKNDSNRVGGMAGGQPGAQPGGMAGGQPGAQPGGMAGGQPGAQPGGMAGGQPGAQPGGMAGGQPGAQPGGMAGGQPGAQPGGMAGGQPGAQPGGMAGGQPGAQPGGMAGGQPGAQPGGMAGGQPGAQPGGMAGGQPGAQPGGMAGGQPGAQPGGMAGGQPGAQPGGMAGGQPGAQPGGMAGGQPGAQPGGMAGGQPGAQPGGMAGGQPGAQPGGMAGGQPGAQPGGMAGGQPGAQPGGMAGGQPGAQPGGMAGGQPGAQPGGMAGGQPGAQPGGMAGGQPGAQPGGMAGGQPGAQPGGMAGGQPGAQPGGMAGGQPGAQPGGMAGGQPGAQPGGMAGGQPGAQPGGMAGGQPGAQPGGMAGGQPGAQPGSRGGQNNRATAGTNPGGPANGDPAGQSSTSGAAGGLGLVDGEMSDGEDYLAAEHSDTGAVVRSEGTYPNLPAISPSSKFNTHPGGLVLPPSPPVGSDTGRDPNLHPVAPKPVATVLVEAILDKPSAARPPTPPAMRAANQPPHRRVPSPYGRPRKITLKPVLKGLTTGSASSRGTIWLGAPESDQPYLSVGSVSDVVDPPLADGQIHSRTVRPRSTPAPQKQEPPPARVLLAVLSVPPPPVPQATQGETAKPQRSSHGIRDGSRTPLPVTPLPDSITDLGDGSGLKGEYYTGREFDHKVFTRADKVADFDCQRGESPDPRLEPGSDYTVRWTGMIEAPTSGTYTLYVAVDDGARVWINHELVLDAWVSQSAREYSGTYTFQGGKQYDLKIEYLEVDGGRASVRLYWEGPGVPKQFIPQSAYFYPLAGETAVLAKDKAP